jgi:hypothetical protein
VCQVVKLNLHSCGHLCHSCIIFDRKSREAAASCACLLFRSVITYIGCTGAESLLGEAVWWKPCSRITLDLSETITEVSKRFPSAMGLLGVQDRSVGMVPGHLAQEIYHCQRLMSVYSLFLLKYSKKAYWIITL